MPIAPFSCLIFDFFGTLVEYAPARADAHLARTLACLKSCGLLLAYEEFAEVWSAYFERMVADSHETHVEFSMCHSGRFHLINGSVPIFKKVAGSLLSTVDLAN